MLPVVSVCEILNLVSNCFTWLPQSASDLHSTLHLFHNGFLGVSDFVFTCIEKQLTASWAYNGIIYKENWITVIINRFGLERKHHLVSHILSLSHTSMGRDIFHYIRLLKAPFCLTFITSMDRASTHNFSGQPVSVLPIRSTYCLAM